MTVLKKTAEFVTPQQSRSFDQSAVIGIDEVGRGCWAGPLLVVAARQKTELPRGLADSKQLSKARRDGLYTQIIAACELGEGWVSAKEVDLLGLTGAMQLAVERALTQLGANNEAAIIMDGHVNYCPSAYTNVQTIVKADAIHPIVSAASIYAKVLRDTHMEERAKQYPEYGFEKHVGYGTKQHAEALKQYGVCVLHRQSYKPIRALL